MSEQKATIALEHTRPLWAVGPSVYREALTGGRLRYEHGEPELHRVAIERIGGIGEPNAGEFLVRSVCGWEGWARALNRNPEGHLACEACLNNARTQWTTWKREWGTPTKREDEDE